MSILSQPISGRACDSALVVVVVRACVRVCVIHKDPAYDAGLWVLCCLMAQKAGQASGLYRNPRSKRQLCLLSQLCSLMQLANCIRPSLVLAAMVDRADGGRTGCVSGYSV